MPAFKTTFDIGAIHQDYKLVIQFKRHFPGRSQIVRLRFNEFNRSANIIRFIYFFKFNIEFSARKSLKNMFSFAFIFYKGQARERTRGVKIELGGVGLKSYSSKKPKENSLFL